MNILPSKLKTFLETTAKFSVVGLAIVIPLSNAATTVFALLLLVAGVLSLDRDKLSFAFKQPITQAIFVFFGLFVLSSMVQQTTDVETSQALRKMSRLLYLPLILTVITDNRWRLAAMIGFIASVLASVLPAIYLHVPLFKDNIFTSLFVASAAFTLLHYSFEFPRFKFLCLALIGLFIYYLFFINIGRTGQILFIGLYLLFAWQRFGANLKKQGIAAFFLIALISLNLLFPSTFVARQAIAAREVQSYLADSTASVTESSMGSRLSFAQHALELVKVKPLFGWGAGAFARAYAEQFPETVADKSATENPHNQYLLTSVDLGLIGLISLISVFVIAIWTNYRRANLFSDVSMGVVLAISIGCLVNSWLLDFASMYCFVVLAGVNMVPRGYASSFTLSTATPIYHNT